MALISAESLGRQSLYTYIGCLVLLLISRHIFLRVREHQKISALGGYSGYCTTWTPLAIGFIISSVRHALRYDDYTFWQNNFARFGKAEHPWTIEVRIFGLRLLNTADEENIKAILATQFHDYGKGEQFNKDFHDFLGDSIFTTDGNRWQESRSLIRPQFIKDRVSDLHTFESHVQTLLPLLSANGNGQSVDAANLFFRYTLDAATDFLLGESVDSLQSPTNRFADAFGEVQRVQSLMSRAGPVKSLLPKKAFYDGLKVLDEFVQPIIERTLRLSPEELEKRTKSDEGYTFLHALASFTRDRKVLRDQLAAVLLAGRDTTACTLSWMFYRISQKPHIVEKLRNEMQSRVGKDRVPTYDDLKSMRYLQHTINETLRLYPVVPFNVRMALKDTTLPRGGGPDGKSPIGILKGTPVAYSTLSLQRRADIYPPTSPDFPDHREFAPERWEMWTPKPWTYIPFNGGPRICVGQQFATTEIAYTAVRILQTYSRIECRMDAPPGEKAEIVLSPSTGINLAFYRDEKS